MNVDNPNLADDTTKVTDEGAADPTKTDSTTATDADKGDGQGDAAKDGATDDATKDDATKGDDTKDESEVVPETYVIPEFAEDSGFMPLEGARLEHVLKVAKDAKFTQTQFDNSLAAYQELVKQDMEFQRGDWAVKSEQEFGKDFEAIAGGAKASLVWAEKERPGITDRLDATNLGNHPDVLWLFNKLGVLTKAQPMRGLQNDTATDEKQSAGDRMYAYADKPVKPQRD